MIDKLIKQFPRATFIILIVFVVLIIIRLLSGGSVGFNEGLAWQFFYTTLYGYTLYYANAIIFVKLDDVYQTDRFSRNRIVQGFALSFIVSVIVIFLLRIVEDVVIEGKTIQQFLANEKPSNYIVSVVITFVVTLAIHAIYFYKAYQENKVKEQKIIAGTASAQFESLKNQIDPHFLFNSLNVLSSLIEENPESAQKFTTSLSKVYRYVLEQKDKELVSVAEELKFAKTYMNLLKMRFENSITFEIPEGFDNEEAKVVPLSLQLLLENCIKHNVVSEAKPLHVKITIENNQLVVTNNLQKKEVLSDRKGVGLQNIVNRYAILTKRTVLVEENEQEFKIFLPILTKQITIMETQNIYNENLAYQRAKDKVEQLKGFYGNLISYCIVIPVLIIINLQSSNNFQWFWFPMLGWGMGLTFHALETFGYGKSWEERKINELMNKDDNSKNWK
ncbi:2TM domain-containing protein [Flavobacterium sp.]|uniref:2TM domain-containing protein n=1 Tax=Flavobacterium sp. TaxID=239 RepID=UPI0008BF6792|nr:2TM domain-containing protein [Flavobacterium sp.]OGS60300.1 MAG: histidine kinase [Flavobacteria bacterium GWF1_32_7]HBD27353.1 histidine kinase [Flavobacterium sp.]